MPERNKRNTVDDDIELSDETEKRIDQLPEHAQHIFKKAHAVPWRNMKTRRRGGVVQGGCKRGGSQGSLGCCEEGLQEKGWWID